MPPSKPLEWARDPDLQAALASVPETRDPLALGRHLRRRLDPERALWAARLLEARARAKNSFWGVKDPLLTLEGLEKATHREVAAWRAQEIAKRSGGAWVRDATAGLGGDALALAAQGIPTLGSDICPLNCTYLEFNRRLLGECAANLRVVCARAETPFPAPFLVLDPDRRPEGTRERDPGRWAPPFPVALDCARRARGAVLKLAPATNLERLRGALPPDLAHTWVWVSLGGELKELALWTGELASPEERVAVRLEVGGAVARFAAPPAEVRALSGPAAEQVGWIGEPDPALVSSGLLGALARELGLAPLGPGIGFLGGTVEPRSPFLRSYTVLGTTRADRKRVRALCRAHDVGPITVKKRGHPLSSEELARTWRGTGRRRGHLFVARTEDGHRAYLVQRTRSATEEQTARP